MIVTGELPSEPYVALVLSSEWSEITSIQEITISGINKLLGVGEREIVLELPKVEIVKVSVKDSPSAEGKAAAVPSVDTSGERKQKNQS